MTRTMQRIERMAGCCLMLAFHVACSGGSSGKAAFVEVDSAGIAIVTNDVLQADQVCAIGAQPTVAIGSAGGDNAYQLHRVFGASQLSDGRIVLVNQGSQQLRFYDATGRHLQSVGRRGRGPGEFENAYHLWVLPGDTIWVGDYRPWQFLVFGPDGKWIRTVRPRPEFMNPPEVMEVFSDGRTLFAERMLAEQTGNQVNDWAVRQLKVVLHSRDGFPLDTIGTYPNGRWGALQENPTLRLFPLFESFSRFASGGQTFVTAHSSQPQFAIHTLDQGLRLKRIVRWNTESRAVTEEEIAAERERIPELYKDLDPAGPTVAPLISKERPIADEFPAFSMLRLGKDGRVWVRGFVRPTEQAAQRWMVFDPDGRFACRATLPVAANVQELGTDYFLALMPDDMGVERVVKYSIAAPAAPAK